MSARVRACARARVNLRRSAGGGRRRVSPRAIRKRVSSLRPPKEPYEFPTDPGARIALRLVRLIGAASVHCGAGAGRAGGGARTDLLRRRRRRPPLFSGERGLLISQQAVILFVPLLPPAPGPGTCGSSGASYSRTESRSWCTAVDSVMKARIEVVAEELKPLKASGPTGFFHNRIPLFKGTLPTRAYVVCDSSYFAMVLVP
ncbi:hypothetical protein EVAR_67248_1 [Eumeta japonica]|uniref:Uncharacterized protein n=1 Tax=Eumeta variegata TaxID=151549 RepID=A0A4C1YUF1_EUMVA|nr:hypothetical protein EVAR_67248_1 [Eumeta japonica]